MMIHSTRFSLAMAVCASALLAACSSVPLGPPDPATETPKPAVKLPPPVGDTSKRGGGYYKDDGPGDNPPANIETIPDAVPKAESPNRFASKPYTVLGRNYVPIKEVGRYKARGLASWYGKKFHGQKTSTGEIYDMYAMTAAHTTLPIPSYARVTNVATGKSVVVRINDRGPFHPGRIIDLSYTAASKLGYIGNGSTMVEVESLLPGAPLSDPDTIIATAPLSNKTEALVVDNDSEAKPLPEIDDAGGAWLQLGAFSTRGNAEALKSRLAREIGDMGDKLVVRAKGNLFRVHLGPWADAREARAVADKLATQFEMRSVLVQK